MAGHQASKTNWGQFADRGYGTEVIYSISDQDFDSRDKKEWQELAGEAWTGSRKTNQIKCYW